MNENIVNNFIKYYVENFNDKTKFQLFNNLWKDYSILTHNNNQLTGQQLREFLTAMNNLTILQDDFISSFTIVGDRRANILLSYKMRDQKNVIFNIAQYIMLAYSNKKEFWIHSSLLNIKQI